MSKIDIAGMNIIEFRAVLTTYIKLRDDSIDILEMSKKYIELLEDLIVENPEVGAWWNKVNGYDETFLKSYELDEMKFAKYYACMTLYTRESNEDLLRWFDDSVIEHL